MSRPKISFAELDHWLLRTPVIAELHPLSLLALDLDVRVITRGELFADELDSRSEYPSGPTLIVDNHSLLRDRFPAFSILEHPPIDAINRRIAQRIEYARNHLTTTRTVSQYIEQDSLRMQSDVVVLFLVDGLSYEDVLDWRCEKLVPCFVDGPSVTYRMISGAQKSIAQDVGFPAIVGNPSVFERLRAHGYRNARGYTYWEPDTNDVANYMFRGIPYFRSPNFDTVMLRIQSDPVQPQTYIQIVRQGLDGLAHGRRELHLNEVHATVDAIKYDLDRLLTLLRRQVDSVVVYLISDHGIAWKTRHEWKRLDNVSSSHSRFTTHAIVDYDDNLTARVECGELVYYLLRMPFLAGSIPYNDSGVHGGISYQESIVPLMTFRR